MSKSLTFEELETIHDTLKEHGFNLNRLRDKETELNNTNTEKHKLLAKIVTARKQANEAACYWTKDDSVQAASWMYLTSLANMLLADYDNRSKQVQRNNIEDIIEIDIEDNTDIVEELSLPPVKIHCSVFFTTILLFLLYVLFGKFPSIYKYTYWLI